MQRRARLVRFGPGRAAVACPSRQTFKVYPTPCIAVPPFSTSVGVGVGVGVR
jgi:hypothetical protein